MKKSTLWSILDALQSKARAAALTDAEWAARAGIRKETLSRLRGRQSCDFATLESLARAVGAGIGLADARALGASEDGLFPAAFDREFEEALVGLCASRNLEVAEWRRLGPAIFMAGLAVMLASVPEFDRPALLDLAEQLHAGSSQVAVFAKWLERSALRPSRFLPMLMASVRRAA